MQDYSTSTHRMTQGKAHAGLDIRTLAASNRVPIIQQFMILRHDITVEKKKLYSRIRDQDERERDLQRDGNPLINASTKNGTTLLKHAHISIARTDGAPPLARPQNLLRDISGMEITLRMSYRVTSIEGFTKIGREFQGTTGLETSTSLPYQLLSVDLTGDSICSLQINVTSPWIFSQGSSLSIVQTKTGRKRVYSSPIRAGDMEAKREIFCEAGRLLNAVLPTFDIDGT